MRPTAGTSPAGQKDSMADHLAGLPAMSGPLDLYPYGRYHHCSRCFFLVLLQRQRPRKEPVDRNHGGKVDVYSIYKETHSSDAPTTRQRHYAGWTTELGSAIWHANEIYEGRDSIEAALVIGSGPKGVEVVYRIGDED